MLALSAQALLFEALFPSCMHISCFCTVDQDVSWTSSVLVDRLKGNASFWTSPVGSETRPALLPESNVPQVANRAPRRGKREGTEDPVYLPEGRLPRFSFAFLVNHNILCVLKCWTYIGYFRCVFSTPINTRCYEVENWKVVTSPNSCVFCAISGHPVFEQVSAATQVCERGKDSPELWRRHLQDIGWKTAEIL